ncbi:MAG: SpoIIE family protein phosphatase [Chloroflexota bacterium]
MAGAFEQCLPQLVAAWRAMTGERLFGWRGAAPAELPEAVQRWASESRAGFSRRRAGGEAWILACSQRTQQDFRIASRDPGGGAGQVLRLLVELLDQFDEEQAASQQYSEELRMAWSQLDFLAELARSVAQGGDLPYLFTRLAKALRQLTAAEETGLILLESETGGRMRTYLSGSGALPANLANQPSRIAAYLQPDAPITILSSESGLPDELAESLPELHNLILAPVSLGEAESSRQCLLVLINHPNARLQAGEQEVLLSAAEQIGMVVSTALARAAQEANRRLEHEVEIASQIQASLLPTHLPSLRGLEFAANLKPAYLVGGDFYDMQPVEDGLAIMVGDVAGKGIPAAMLTALIHATLKSEAQRHSQPAELLGSINRLIYEELDRSGTFITAFLAVLQTNPLRLSYTSAGHTTTLLWRASAQEVVQLGSTGMPLGVTPGLELGQRQILLESGDVLMLYSDGVTEAENATGRVFGMQAMIDLLLAMHQASPQAQLEIILKALELHRQQVSLRDDVVLFLVRVDDCPPRPCKVIPFVYLAEASAVRALALQARQVAAQMSFPSPSERVAFLNDIELAVSEIITNVVTHAYRQHPYTGRVQGCFTLHPDRLCIDMFDNGATFQPTFDAAVDRVDIPAEVLLTDPPVSGYGLIIASRLLDVCQYAHLSSERNHWHLEKYLPGRAGGCEE